MEESGGGIGGVVAGGVGDVYGGDISGVGGIIRKGGRNVGKVR